MNRQADPEWLSLTDIERSLRGAIPVSIATADLSGRTNVTYVSRIHYVDPQRVAISNQFLGRTARNVAQNPQASLLVIDPLDYSQFRLSVVYERTDRRGPVFDKLRADIDALAQGAQGEGAVSRFRLRSADIFRVLEVVCVFGRLPLIGSDAPASPHVGVEIGELVARAPTSSDALDIARREVARNLRQAIVQVFLLDANEQLRPLSTPQSDASGIRLGDGPIGGAVLRGETRRWDNIILTSRYARALAAGEAAADAGQSADVEAMKSAIVSPIMSRGELIGAVVATHPAAVYFSSEDELVVRSVAIALQETLLQVRDATGGIHGERDERGVAKDDANDRDGTLVRVHRSDGSVFINDEYVIRGHAGDILGYVLAVNAETGRERFTNRELRVAPELDIPGLRKNIESRLLSLIRRLDELAAPIRIEKTERGRFRLVGTSDFSLEVIADG
jgi:hypothetical protein